ncbi:non-hydrolyzing UDP-N-acetylglucosamine 2-epimerase [Pseudomonas sp. CC6-YY-74]|uniref:non-hydrolyzing UDP-N-acetylglucosamine 2-epimerase n=1 Tax=Pseudomonas sp. CC6-YY-74 TaxID=1930532 RepID=UPI00273A6D56|nr:UDP-N-acetylglucosamine 2-epimerase (non-hydrolyzing) [Pseudomonas sp. CC6-YY-74]
MLVFGTRPEAIKMAPVAQALAAADDLQLCLCVSGQHREMLDDVLGLFSLSPDHDLDVMTPGQTLNGLSAAILAKLDHVLQVEMPDMVLVHGDTTTSFAAALAAFHRGIPVGHVEAGLRTNNLYAPWPEEANRRLTGVLANLHFAPTAWAQANLLKEGVPAAQVSVTGNTVIDALMWMRAKLREMDWRPADSTLAGLGGEARMVLITGHRRENFGDGFLRICQALRSLAQRYPEVRFIYPVHLNPRVQEPVYRLLDGLPNLLLIAPQSYQSFVYLMDRASIILTDSGGVQEEAPSLGKPVLVMRDTTERPEAVAAGTVRLVGTDEARIVEEVSRLLDDPAAYAAMQRTHNPYGDGQASARIVEQVRQYLMVGCQ